MELMHCLRRSVVVVLGLLFLAACGKQPQLAAIPAGHVVLAFGDSVTFGTGASPGEDWPALLGRRTGWRMVNAGIPGDTAEAAKERLGEQLQEHHPVLVMIEIGGNDFLRRRTPQAVKEDIRQLIQTAKKRQVQVVLIAVPELSLLGAVTGKPSDSPIYRQLAEEEMVPVVSNVFADVLGTPDQKADQIHPNAAGYQRMTDEIFMALQKIGLAR